MFIASGGYPLRRKADNVKSLGSSQSLRKKKIQYKVRLIIKSDEGGLLADAFLYQFH